MPAGCCGSGHRTRRERHERRADLSQECNNGLGRHATSAPAPSGTLAELVGLVAHTATGAAKLARAQYSRDARKTLYSPYTAAPINANHSSAPAPPAFHSRDVATSVIAANPAEP
jgi:hypothetical protein